MSFGFVLISLITGGSTNSGGAHVVLLCTQANKVISADQKCESLQRQFDEREKARLDEWELEKEEWRKEFQLEKERWEVGSAAAQGNDASLCSSAPASPPTLDATLTEVLSRVGVVISSYTQICRQNERGSDMHRNCKPN
jgi:hypothetical protein